MKKRILNINNCEIGNKILQKRIELNFSQEMLATKLQVAGLDISRATLSKIELGTRQLYVTELKIFAQVLNCNLEYFVK